MSVMPRNLALQSLADMAKANSQQPMVHHKDSLKGLIKSRTPSHGHQQWVVLCKLRMEIPVLISVEFKIVNKDSRLSSNFKEL